ncbi:Ground-like domain and Major facilitator superfamily domain, general substrate transporter-containing protein [Strongyloides ratti]|uniref:Ground-like domain and Major facilitator superfamily domain, general substrate transporter-containing protein n=1 Tax=Strongyloides ratti TaxID=34506 RepID=A0A090LHV7_STRRB|nr:Ground-like domain and Major facilitator superfamily domain, general substrate transporter-containing protein [Strongyloides ratti]CEF69401.1 Ground-like domain and Major facilitator superfamily domain, general substrate transporter-containing protein [Strongyloides ratti]
MYKNLPNFNHKNAYTYTSGFLLFGSLLQSFSLYYFVVIGRILLGIGTGIGFIIIGITITQMTNYESRPKIFLIPSIMFSLDGYKKIDMLHDYDDNIRIITYYDINIPKNIYHFTILLVLLNVSVGVPIIMAFSIEIFKFYGYTIESAIGLSFFYPIIQIIFLCFINITGKSFTRFTLIYKGFLLSFSLLFIITSLLFIPSPTSSHTKTYILGTLTILLSMVSSIPCSTIHCIYIELFQSSNEHIKISSIARVYLWIFSFIATFTFPILFSNFGLFIIFLIHLIITGIFSKVKMISYFSIVLLLHSIINILSLNSGQENVEIFSKPPSNLPISKVFIFGKPYYIRDMKAKIRSESNDLNSQSSFIKSTHRFSNQEHLMRDYIVRNHMDSYSYPQPSYPSPQPSYPSPQPSYPSPQQSYPSPQQSYPSPQPSYPSPPEAVIRTDYEKNITTYHTTPSYAITTTSSTTPPSPKKNNDYPLESCYTNKSGFMCCNEELEQLIYKTFNDLLNSKDGKWNKCNIQEIANRIQKNAQQKFDLKFESIAGIGDFASKSNFYGDNICKVEISGRYMLAYASPVQKPKMFENPDSLPYHKIKM